MKSHKQTRRKAKVSAESITNKKLTGDSTELLESNVQKDMPSATRRSNRIRVQKKASTEWLSEIPSEKENSSEEEYAATASSSSSDNDEVSSISSKGSSNNSFALVRRQNSFNDPDERCYKPSFTSTPNRASLFQESMEWTFDKMRQLEKQFKVSHEKLLPIAKNLVKSTKEFSFDKSPPFSIVLGNKTAVFKNRTLDAFSAVPVSTNEDELIFYVGGPVSALSWCPRSMSMSRSSQYLAISTSFGLHSASITYKEPTLIQLWKCGDLGISNNSPFTPEVSLKIHVCDGPVWDLKWCRLGGYAKSDDGLARLGILAAACASGRVLVMSLPDPDYHTEYSDGSTYNVTPNITLVPCIDNESEIDNLFGQCLCIDWCLKSGGKWLAGGFSKGMVALWKIGEPSTLLQSSSPNGHNELIACRTFTAHTQPVRSVCWCPFEETVFATASSDCRLKFWNRHSVHAPTLETPTKLGSLTDMLWPILWCGVITSTDEVFARPNVTGVLYNDRVVPLTNPVNIIPFKSCCQSISFSDYMNLCVGVDSNGLVILCFADNMSSMGFNKSKRKTHFRLISSSLSVKWLSNGEATDTEDAKYEVTYCDSKFGDIKTLPKRPCYTKARNMDKFTSSVSDNRYVQSANRVSWNPNFGSHTWYSTGYQCGLVRVQSVNTIHDSIKELYDELAEKVQFP